MPIVDSCESATMCALGGLRPSASVLPRPGELSGFARSLGSQSEGAAEFWGLRFRVVFTIYFHKNLSLSKESEDIFVSFRERRNPIARTQNEGLKVIREEELVRRRGQDLKRKAHRSGPCTVSIKFGELTVHVPNMTKVCEVLSRRWTTRLHHVQGR